MERTKRMRAQPSTGNEIRAKIHAGLPVRERRLTLAGVSTAVLHGGDGPPMVVLHGIGQFAGTWMRVIPELTATNTVVIPDLPGQGASELDGSGLDVTRVLDWLGELLDATCSAPPVLVGHNIGGAIAARFACQHGDRLTNLVLVDAFGLGPFRPTPKFALRSIQFQLRPTEHSRDRMLGQCMVDLDAVHDDMGEQWELLADYALDRARTPSMKAAGRTLMKGFGLPAIPEAELAHMNVPTTLIWGRDDPETRLRFAEAAAARYGWPIHVIDDCGADPNIERPSALVEALQTALTGS